MRRVAAMILAGGQGADLGVLTHHRPASAMPFGGMYRVIDFSLSNCVNSDIYRVAVLTQYAPKSLNEHIRTGRAWDLDRRRGGVKLLQAYARRGESRWYTGTADAIAQNLGVLEQWGAHWVLVLSGDQVYTMDYGRLIAAHQRSGAPLTVTVKQVAGEESHRFGIVDVDRQQRMVSFEEKPARARASLANIGVYVFDAALVRERLDPSAGVVDLVLDVVIPLLREGTPIHCHRFDGYWNDVGTVDAYFRSNMELLAPNPRLNLSNPDWPVHTPSAGRPPARCTRTASVRRSMIAGGAVVRGTVEDSILFPGVVVERGAHVRSAIIMSDSVVEAGATVDLAVLDKQVRVGKGAVVGDEAVSAAGRRSRSNVVVVGKAATIPAGSRIARSRVIDIGATVGSSEAAERRSRVPAGSS